MQRKWEKVPGLIAQRIRLFVFTGLRNADETLKYLRESSQPCAGIGVADEGYIWLPLTYVVFKNCVVQFFNDNLNDYHGMLSTLYETIADEVLTGPAVTDVYFNTDITYAAIKKSPKNWP